MFEVEHFVNKFEGLENNLFLNTSWDDPHFPIVQGIIRRGLKVRALKQFILEQVIYH